MASSPASFIRSIMGLPRRMSTTGLPLNMSPASRYSAGPAAFASLTKRASWPAGSTLPCMFAVCRTVRVKRPFFPSSSGDASRSFGAQAAAPGTSRVATRATRNHFRDMRFIPSFVCFESGLSIGFRLIGQPAESFIVGQFLQRDPRERQDEPRLLLMGELPAGNAAVPVFQPPGGFDDQPWQNGEGAVGQRSPVLVNPSVRTAVRVALQAEETQEPLRPVFARRDDDRDEVGNQLVEQP